MAKELAERITLLNMAINTLLAVLKLTVGWLSGSAALLSDGLHSVTDVVSSCVVLIGIRLSRRRSDAQHPYGHERLECVAALILSILVGATGIGIGIGGIQTIVTAVPSAAAPGTIALAAAIASVVIKEIMFRYTRLAARRSQSSALYADAWHLRTDALSSVGSVIGVLGANSGWYVLDPLAAVLIGALILKAAAEIFFDAIRKMIDRSCDEDLGTAIAQAVCGVAGVDGIDEFKTRLFGSRVYTEVTVVVDDRLSASEAYVIAGTIRETVESQFPVVKSCSVHILPGGRRNADTNDGFIVAKHSTSCYNEQESEGEVDDV